MLATLLSSKADIIAIVLRVEFFRLFDRKPSTEKSMSKFFKLTKCISVSDFIQLTRYILLFNFFHR